MFRFLHVFKTSCQAASVERFAWKLGLQSKTYLMHVEINFKIISRCSVSDVPIESTQLWQGSATRVHTGWPCVVDLVPEMVVLWKHVEKR